MTHNSETGSDGFDSQIEALFDTPSPGLESPDLEGRILARLVQRRQVRALVLGLGGLVGAGIALRSLLDAGVPSPTTQALIDMATGNTLVHALYGVLGDGLAGSLAVCGGLTGLGLALVRALEEA